MNLSFDCWGIAHSADLKRNVIDNSLEIAFVLSYGDSGIDGAFSENDMERLAFPLCGGVGVGAAGNGPDGTTVG